MVYRVFALRSLIARTFIAASVATSHAASMVDTSFAQGAWNLNTPDYPDVVAVVPMASRGDGSLLVIRRQYQSPTFSAAVQRLTPSGMVDTAFGNGGVALLPAPATFDPAAIAEDAQGRILVGGLYPGAAVALARLLPDGSIDRSFGSDGLAAPSSPSGPASTPCHYQKGSAAAKALRVVALADGRVTVFGNSSEGYFLYPQFFSTYACVLVARFDDSGRLDASFGTAGLVLSAFGDKWATAVDGRVEADGSLTAIGYAGNDNGSSVAYRLARWRLAANGVASPAEELAAVQASKISYHGPRGWLIVQWDRLRALSSEGTAQMEVLHAYESRVEYFGRTPDGGIYAISSWPRPNSTYLRPSFYVRFCRWRSDGSPDALIEATTGCAEVDVGLTSFDVSDVLEQPDGSLMLTGSGYPPCLFCWGLRGLVVRFNTAPPMIEYFNTVLGHYFMTYDSDEAQGIDRGGAGAGWQRTGATFTAGGTSPVCRFYGTPGVGPNSHFFTVDAAECAGVKKDRGWFFEGLGFYATPAVNQKCPPELRAVHRLYNNRAMFNDSNHRHVVDPPLIAPMVARGWIHEGVAFCARP
jgi:uncharacterized delta-60 repeat protein